MKEDVPDAVLDIIDWIPDQTRAWESSTNAYITANLSDRLSFTNLVPRKFGNEIRCHFETNESQNLHPKVNCSNEFC